MARVLIDVDRVTITRPERDLFRDVSITVNEGDRVGLVGINGTGKSTLLRVMAGITEPESGEVRRGRDVQVVMLDQLAVLPSGTVREAVAEGSDEAAWEAEAVLDRLGMTPFLDVATDRLSGGEAKRVALARALLAPSDLLILDEPTNHLDITAIAWLEARLARHRGALVLVTHDRHVLDRVTTRVLELDRGRSHLHSGGYQGYLDGRAAREEMTAATESTIRNLARRELAWLRRGAPARTSKAKARIRAAEALVEHKPEAAARSDDLNLHMGTPRLGDLVLELHDVSFGFRTDEQVFSKVDLLLDRRERLGVVGLNGTGKTTLLSVLSGRLQPSSGERVVGPTVRLGEFLQHGPELDGDQRVIHALTGRREPTWQDKALLERFWFDSDIQRSPVRLLSGGERRRLQLVLTLVAQPNVLLLDEPTNDLDLDTLRILEDFLDSWPGALVVVSHDRAFLERTVDDVVIVENHRVRRVPGGYETWERETLARGGPGAASRPAATKKGGAKRADRTAVGRSVSTIRRDLGQAESEMARAQTVLDALAAEVASTVDHLELARLGEGIRAAGADVDAAEERWLELSQELEDRLNP